MWFSERVVFPKDADGMANSVDFEQSDLGLHFLPRAVSWSENLGSFIYEPRHEKACFMPCANNKDADQPAHPRSLISVFVVRFLDSTLYITCTC